MTSTPVADPRAGLDDDVVRFCRELIRFDTTNHGESATVDGAGSERPAAEYVAERLAEAGLEPTLVEAAPGRTNVIARVPGTDPDRSALLVHGHLDVVGADPSGWTHPPFAAEIAEDCVWGRGAVDMKHMLAMMLAVVSKWHAQGQRPQREIVLAFLADEEAGSRLGAHWLVEHRPELFEGCTEAVSELGGFSWTAPDGRRAYFAETARKGVAWRRLVARGAAGHASMPRPGTAIAKLSAAVTRVAEHHWQPELLPTTARVLTELSELLGVELDHRDADQLRRHLGTAAELVIPALSHTAVVTNLSAGTGAPNVIPATASALVDGRYLPGRLADFDQTLKAVVGPDIEVSAINTDEGSEHPFDTPLVDAMRDALAEHDPGALLVPYCPTASTDNSAFVRLGMRGYGFVPLQMPAGLSLPDLLHSDDERIPLTTLRFGARCLDTFLREC